MCNGFEYFLTESVNTVKHILCFSRLLRSVFGASLILTVTCLSAVNSCVE